MTRIRRLAPSPALVVACLALVVGTVLFLALGFIFHPLVVGVAVFGTPAH